MPNKFNSALTRLAQLDKSVFEPALRHIVSVDAGEMNVARVSYWGLSSDHSSITCQVLFEKASATYSNGHVLRATDYPGYFRALLANPEIVADDAWTDPRTSEFVDAYFRPFGIRSMLDIPVWRRGVLAGVLCHEHVGPARTWASDERAFAAGIANMISVALEAGDRRRAEEGYTLVGRATNDVLWDWDMQRNVIEWNDALFSAFRFRPDQVAETIEWWLERVSADDRVRVKRDLKLLIDSGGTSYSDEYRFERGDGSIATVIDRGTIVRDADGVPVRMVGSMLDISDRIEMQARLALSDRLASIGTLAAGIAHEINNPLTYVMANIALVIDDVEAEIVDHRSVQELLGEARDGADRIRQIVRGLQMLSRPNEEEIQHVDVAAVFESTIKMASNELRHRAQLIREFGEVPKVRMNSARLGQVMLNLLVNAAHSIKVGNASLHQIRVRTATAPNGDAVVEVRDSGCGIPREVQSRIFEPFFTTKPIGSGTGLGLSLCHSIVAAAGGKIEVFSEPGQGTTMRVTLPAATEEPAPPQKLSAVQGPRLRVLVVDDEPMIRRCVQRMLEPQHTVAVVESGASALAEIETGKHYDVVLCDLMMPRMTGIELYSQLVESSSSFANRIVFMTGGAFGDDSERFVQSCDRPIVGKPLDRRMLEHALASVMQTGA
ncbi:MAG: response regulator [Deltaproteobacteria bacterium]|nr:response regulator [Deltaproteobacteria bacterium]